VLNELDAKHCSKEHLRLMLVLDQLYLLYSFENPGAVFRPFHQHHKHPFSGSLLLPCSTIKDCQNFVSNANALLSKTRYSPGD
jgi:hypothetical protein